MKIIDSNLPPPIENPSIFRRIINRLCGYETMSGNGQCPVYLERWTIAEAFGCGIYLHHFLGDDWAIDPHDHPRRFISIGLRGWYYEDVFKPADFQCPHPNCDKGWLYSAPVGCGIGFQDEDDGPCPICSPKTTKYVAPWIRSFPANHVHRVRAVECGNVWTLVIVLRKSRAWGFIRDGVWIPFREYVFGGKSRKAC